jgi:hypothetical protein
MEATLPSRRTARASAERFLQTSDLNSQISNFKSEITIFEFRSEIEIICRVLFLFEDKTGAGQLGESLFLPRAHNAMRARRGQ